MEKVRVLVADEERLFREGICALLKDCTNIEVIGEATNGNEALEMVREQAPDVVLTNLFLPIISGTEVTRRVRKEKGNVKVLLLTQYEDGARILSGLKAGAHGYISRRATASDLISAILNVYRWGSYLYPSVARTILDDYLKRMRQPENSDPYEQLTHREREVLKLLAEGSGSNKIAGLLGITPAAVTRYRTNLMRKLSIHNRSELVKYAVRKHLLHRDEKNRLKEGVSANKTNNLIQNLERKESPE